MNAFKEFEKHTKDLDVLCARLYTEEFDYDSCKNIETKYILPIGYSGEQLISFLKEIDFDYDEGYGGQELFGIIWYKDGTWSERYEYDGSECWDYKSRPEIPNDTTITVE